MNNVIRQMTGKVLAIGVNEKIVKQLEKNDNIDCSLLDSISSKGKGKGRSKTIKIKKIRKVFKKKRIDYIICDYEVIYKYLNTFIKDSVYINKNKIYFVNALDKELITKRYSRYNTKIEIKKDYIEIDNSKAKNNLFKDLFYRVIDGINNIIELIGDVLMG